MLQAPISPGLIASGLGASDPLAMAPDAAPAAPAQYPDVISVGDLDGTNGFTLTDSNPHEVLGFSASAAGDINGDGFDDIIVGTLFDRAYVVFGSASGFPATLDVTNLDGTDGFRLRGENYSYAGRAVAGVGDINGDGVDDLMVGAPMANSPAAYTGAAYVVFGTTHGFAPSVSLTGLHGTSGFVLNGGHKFDYAGGAVSAAGDVNGDGFADMIVGSDSPSGYSGPSYVVFGHDGGFGGGFSLRDIDGTNGFKLADGGDSEVGARVAAAGDVNGDGFDDVMIAAPRDYSSGAYTGAAYVVFGSAGPFSASVDLSTLDGTNGFKMIGADYSYAATSVSSAGDINGDGFADLIVGDYMGAPGGLHHAGYSHVVFGHAGGFDPVIDLEALDGTIGFTLDGTAEEQHSGFSVSSAGDVNGDGFDDLLIGATYDYDAVNGYVGAAYVMFGGASGFAAHVSLADLTGDKGFKVQGVRDYAELGFTVASAGDVNGDGLDDLLVTAPAASGYDGTAYVVLGVLPDAAVHRSGTIASQTLVGGDFDDGLKGRSGDDVLWGHDGKDRLSGGFGDDTLIGGAGKDALQGGSGNDVFRYQALGDSDLASRDTIKDLAAGDLIDLSRIDANTTKDGDQAFHLVSSFTGHAGELELVLSGHKTLLMGDVDGDGSADLVVKLSGDQTAFTGFVL